METDCVNNDHQILSPPATPPLEMREQKVGIF